MRRKLFMKRICVFFDGYWFRLGARYFSFVHPIQRSIDFGGLLAYIQRQTAEALGEKDCAIIGSHLYLGVPTGRDVSPEQAKKELAYRDMLRKFNISGHFYDLWTNKEGIKKEKIVDEYLTCDAVEMACNRDFDVLALITGDGHYIPMVEKLKEKAIDTVLFWWDLPSYTTVHGIVRNPQRTSEWLLRAVTYNVDLTHIADKRKKTDLEDNIFVKTGGLTAKSQHRQQPFQRDAADKPGMPAPGNAAHPPMADKADRIQNLVMNTEPRELTMDELNTSWESIVVSIHPDGWGYIKGPVGFINRALNNFQFSGQDISGGRPITDFNIGDRVEFRLKYDARRSEKLGHTLYRAYNVTLIDDQAASSVPAIQPEPEPEVSEPETEFAKHDPINSHPATTEYHGVPSPGQHPRAELIKHVNANPAAYSETEYGERRKYIVVKKRSAHVNSEAVESIPLRPGAVGGKYVGPSKYVRPRPKTELPSSPGDLW
jgi:uncharacterized LabA/DUF88 family protein